MPKTTMPWSRSPPAPPCRSVPPRSRSCAILSTRRFSPARRSSPPAWIHLYRALVWASTHPARSQLLSTLDAAVLVSLRQRRPELALHFQDRLLRLAGKLPARGAVAAGRQRRARIAAALGRTEEARRDLRRALFELPLVTGEVHRALVSEIEAMRQEIE